MQQLNYITKASETDVQLNTVFLLGDEGDDDFNMTQQQLTEIENKPNFICWMKPKIGYIFYTLQKAIRSFDEVICTKEEFDKAIPEEEGVEA